jgi:hypothetical protein
MAAEVVLVPKEKYQKLLESHEQILNDSSYKDNLTMSGGEETQNKADDMNDRQKEININRDEKGGADLENVGIHHQVKRKLSDMNENYIESKNVPRG